MNTVTIKPLEHKGTQVVGIYFEKDIQLNSVLQKAVSAKWSRSKKCWYMECTKETCNKLNVVLKGSAILDGKAMRDYFKQSAVETNYNVSKNNASDAHTKTDYNPSLQMLPAKKSVPPNRLCDANADALSKFNQTLVLKGYSLSTIRTYVGELSVFLQTLGNTTAESLALERIKDYLFYCHTTLKLSEHTIHSRMNALHPVGLKK